MRQFLLSLFLIAMGVGCRSAAEAITRDLQLNLGIEPATIDPALATDPGSQQIARMIFLSLVDTDAATGAPQHALATSWGVSTDGLIWEFKLRPDAMWVRYNPANERIETKRAVNAQDIVYSVRRVFDPRVGSGFAPTLAPILRGAEQLRAANPKTSDADFERLFANLGVQATDDLTVRFILTRPASYFPTVVSTWLVRTQPREAIEEGGTVWTEPGKLWTNGPYLLERWSHNREIVLQRNPHYFDAANVQVEHIRLAMIANTAVALAEYKKGNLDTLDPYGELSTDDYEELREDPTLNKQLTIAPTLCTHYYGFNTTKPPFNDALVRKAFVAAIDRDTIATSFAKLGEPARWFTRPGGFASSPISDTLGAPVAFNVTLARDYLRQAGYDGRTKRLPAVTLGVNTDDLHQAVAEAAVQMWKTNLNADVRVEVQDWKGYLQTLRNDPPQIFRLGYCAYFPESANFANVFRTKSPDNFARWSNPAYDQLIDNAARQVDVLQRRGLYRSAEKILIEDNAVIVPLWWSARATLTKPNIRRTFAITDGYERFDNWEIK